MFKVLVVATSRKTRGGITSVINAHEKGAQWKHFHCRWIETHIDKGWVYKLWYFITGFIQYLIMLPFYNLVHIHTSEPPSAFRKCIFMAYFTSIRDADKIIIMRLKQQARKQLFIFILSHLIQQFVVNIGTYIIISLERQMW